VQHAGGTVPYEGPARAQGAPPPAEPRRAWCSDAARGKLQRWHATLQLRVRIQIVDYIFGSTAALARPQADGGACVCAARIELQGVDARAFEFVSDHAALIAQVRAEGHAHAHWHALACARARMRS
jgi:hypothetical protein